MKIKYGIIGNNIDITNFCINKLQKNNTINIPFGDCNRARIFSDPCYGIVKKIFISINNDDIFDEYEQDKMIEINLIIVIKQDFRK